MRAEAGRMPESLVSPIGNSPGASNDRLGFKVCPVKIRSRMGRVQAFVPAALHQLDTEVP